jgi:putative hydrolase of the HAD superfamily
MTRLRAVFLDAGDTLIHRWVLKANRFAWLCRQASIPLPDDPTRVVEGAAACERFFQDRRRHHDAKQPHWFVRMYLAGLSAMGLEGDLHRLAERIHETARALPETQVVDPEAVPLLEHLRSRGYRLALVSNWDGSLVDLVRRLGLGGYFDAVLDSGVVGRCKPDAHLFHIACAATGVEPQEAVHVGDSPDADVAGAMAAGIHPVLLDALNLFADGFPGLASAIRIRRLSDLPAVLADWNS